MFTLSANIQRQAAERVCGLLAERLKVDPPETYTHPWEILVDGYLPVEVHFTHGKVLFVGVIKDFGSPGEDPVLVERALNFSRERLATGELVVSLEPESGRLLVWVPADEQQGDRGLLEQFSRFLKEFDLWFASLIDKPGGDRHVFPAPRYMVSG